MNHPIKQETNMGDSDNNQFGNSRQGEGSGSGVLGRTATDMTEPPLTEEEYSKLETQLRESQLNGMSNIR